MACNARAAHRSTPCCALQLVVRRRPRHAVQVRPNGLQHGLLPGGQQTRLRHVSQPAPGWRAAAAAAAAAAATLRLAPQRQPAAPPLRRPPSPTGDCPPCCRCLPKDSCCSQYEACVSCCLAPANGAAELAKTLPLVPNRPDTRGAWKDAFEFCR